MTRPKRILREGSNPAGMRPAEPSDSPKRSSGEKTSRLTRRTVRNSFGPGIRPSNFRPGRRYKITGAGNVRGEDAGRIVSPIRFPLMTIDFAELSDGSLIDFVEDPQNSKNTLLAIWKDGEVTYRERLEYEGRTLIPPLREGQILKYIRLPRGANPYPSNRSLFVELGRLISRFVSVKETDLAMLVHFVLCTWLADRLPVAPYLSLVGLLETGKTTLLKVLGLFCRRPLLTADITSAAFYRSYERLSPTLLIDEAGTIQDKRVLYHLLRMGTTRDVVAMRKNQVFRAYGPKVLTWQEPPDDPALNSRCIQIQMTEANHSDVDRPTDSELEELAAELQAQLLQFRFQNYKTIRTCNPPGTETLRPRSRDLLACFAAPFAEDAEICERLVDIFKEREISSREPLSPSQSAVLAGLFFCMHINSYSGAVLVKNLTSKVNRILRAAGQPLRLQPRKVGAVLTTLGFSRRERTNAGWNIILDSADQERVHQLIKVHGIDYFSDQFTDADLGKCQLCQEMRSGQWSAAEAR
jgi:hypothetical protein